MQLPYILTKFNQGINWNAILYATYKVTSTAITLIAFHILPTNDFSLWATTQSILFLILLWIDFGFRKSIPRFCPEFTKNKAALKKFITSIIGFQLILLCCATPIFWKVLTAYTAIQSYTPLLLWLLMVLFITEGISALIKLIYHAHFWNKQFNTMAVQVTMIQSVADICILCTIHTASTIVIALFITKIAASIYLNAQALIQLKINYAHKNDYESEASINEKETYKAFVKHSAIMWVNNSIKSLSERNALFPYLTFIMGPAQANIFKVAHESAIFMHRIVVKSIGTTDTALLSHVSTFQESKSALPIAFKKLLSKVSGLCFPLLVFFLCVSSLLYIYVPEYYVFQTFIIISSGYLLETILSPFERVLEVNKDYWRLCIAYTPYVITLAVLAYVQSKTFIGLLNFILILHSVRLVSSFITFYYAHTRYALNVSLKDFFSFIPLSKI